MRTIKVHAPKGEADKLILSAFQVGIDSVSLHQLKKISFDGTQRECDLVEVETSTPKAKKFVDNVLSSNYFDCHKFSISVRQPRSILQNGEIGEITYPIEEPGVDLFQELWQFSQITYGLVCRVLIAGLLLSYGLIEQKLLFMIGGLLFLPMLPMLLAVSFGVTARQRKLGVQGLTAFLLSSVLLFVGGVIVALAIGPPLRFNEFSPFWLSVSVSAIVGIAAGLASIDDAGRRELIGLAAASQVGIIPAWFGVVVVLGPPPSAANGEVGVHFLSFFANVVMLLAAVALVQYASGVSRGLRKLATFTRIER